MEGVKKGERKKERKEREREREKDAFYEVCFIGQFVAEPETWPLLCRTALRDCFKDSKTSFIGSVSFS